MPETIYKEEEIILAVDFFSNYNAWEIGKALRQVIRHVEKELLKREEDETVKATFEVLANLKNCIYKYTGYSEGVL